MKLKTQLFFAIIAIVLQPLFLSLLPEAMAPNLGFCILIVCVATMEEKLAVVPIAIITVASIFVDLFSNQFVGATAISMLIVALAISIVRSRLDLENPLYIIGVALAANILYEIIYWMIYRTMGTPYGFIYMLKSMPLGIIVDFIVMIIGLFFAGRRLGRIRRENYFKKMNW